MYMANIRRILMLEIASPLAVRREVSFCEAVHDGHKTVEGVQAVNADGVKEIKAAWNNKTIAVSVDPNWQMLERIKPNVVVDSILAKKNLGTTRTEASLVIGLGPGFVAGEDVHFVIETNRGHNLGRIITSGAAEPNTGIPGYIGGYTEERVLRAPVRGEFITTNCIGDQVREGEVTGSVAGEPVKAKIAGVIRGLIRSSSHVPQGLKLGDIDPREDVDYCYTISDKARAIAGSVLEAILRVYNYGS
jgi:xanthine dehydrogenase accessory factor